MSHWKQITGSGPSSPSSPCTRTMMGTRQDLQPSSSGVPHVRGGTTTWPCFLLALDSLGRSSKKLSRHIIKEAHGALGPKTGQQQCDAICPEFQHTITVRWV